MLKGNDPPKIIKFRGEEKAMIIKLVILLYMLGLTVLTRYKMIILMLLPICF